MSTPDPTHEFLRDAIGRELPTPIETKPAFRRTEQPLDNFYRGPVRTARCDETTPGERNFGDLIGG